MLPREITCRLLDRSHAPAMHAINRCCPIAADFTFYLDRSPDCFAWPDQVFDGYQYLGIFEGARLVGYIMVGFQPGWTGAAWGRTFYFGDARLLPAYRRQGLMQEAARQLEACIPQDVSVGFCLIKRGNTPANRLFSAFTSETFVLEPLCTFEAVSIPLLFRLRPPGVCAVRRATVDDAGEVVRVLSQAHEGRLFAPAVSEDALRSTWASVPGLEPEHFYVAEDAGRIVGVLALWDMDRLHRMVILHHSLRGRLVRAAFNLAARFLPLAVALPAPGRALRALTGVYMAVRNDDPQVLRDLLASAMADHAGQGYHLIHLGLTSDDPLQKAFKRIPAFRFRSDIMLAVRPEHRDVVRNGPRIPCIDLAII
jgi:GNAT superfamily N-acetyltransferase